MNKAAIVTAVMILSMTAAGFAAERAGGGTPFLMQEKAGKEQQASAYLEKGMHRGRVVQTMNSGSYTYIEFEEDGQTYWAAAPEFKIAVGDDIEFESALPMKEFTSKTLNRTFAQIYFINVIKVGEVGSAPGKAKIKITVEPGSITKAEDGYTVAECYTKRDSLHDRVVKVRGRVVKFTTKIMNRNWIHLQDGTGQEGSNDLPLTTTQQAQPGDLIVVTGKLVKDKDFGAGYFYPVIVEDAAIVIETEKNPFPLVSILRELF